MKISMDFNKSSRIKSRVSKGLKLRIRAWNSESKNSKLIKIRLMNKRTKGILSDLKLSN